MPRRKRGTGQNERLRKVRRRDDNNAEEDNDNTLVISDSESDEEEEDCGMTPRTARRLDREKKTHVQDMTEDEMLALALRLSKQEANCACQREQVEDDDMRKAIAESLQVSCSQTSETSFRQTRSAAKPHRDQDSAPAPVRCKLSFSGRNENDGASAGDVSEAQTSRLKCSEDSDPLPPMPDLSPRSLSQPSPLSPTLSSVPSAASQESRTSRLAKQEVNDEALKNVSLPERSPILLRHCSVRINPNLLNVSKPSRNVSPKAHSSLSFSSPEKAQNSPPSPKSPVFPKTDSKRCTTLTRDKAPKLELSSAADTSPLNDFTSHMVLHLTDDDDEDDDDKVISPSPVFPQDPASCPGQPNLSPTQPCSSSPTADPNHTGSLSQVQSARSRVAPTAEKKDVSAVSYYWGVPFCPKGQSPDDYTQVILAQLEVYEKSLKEARKHLLHKADWGHPVFPCPVEKPHGRRLKRHRAPRVLEEDEEEDEEQNGDEKKRKKPAERAESQPNSEDVAENGQQETYVVVSSPETQEELGQKIPYAIDLANNSNYLIRSRRKPPPQELSENTPIHLESDEHGEEDRRKSFDVESAVCPETQMTEDHTPELMVTSPSPAQADADVMEVDEASMPVAEAEERMEQGQPGEEPSWRESVSSQVECPMCTRLFPLGEIEMHAAYCNGTLEDQEVQREEQENVSQDQGSARRRSVRRTAVEDYVRFEKSEQQEKCYVCNKFFTRKEYSHHVDRCLHQKQTSGTKQGNGLLTALNRTETMHQGPPCCLRGSFAFYKSVGFRPETGGPVKVWRLGEFYYVRCGPQEPVCIAEITLLWEDQRQRHPLASSRLYYLPEDTPKGRSKEHGEDEVIGVSKKVVVRVEHLVKWTCLELPEWKQNPNKFIDHCVLNGSSCLTDPQEVKAKDDVPGVRHRVKVLSYPQYCRFRSLQKRIQDHGAQPGPQDPHLLALGWIRMTLHNTRILYCRDTFSHPSLGTNPSLTPEFGCLSVSLKGRPRKRRGRDGDEVDQQILNHPESRGERVKENVMSSAETIETHWLPHPEEKIFLDQLYLFMERHGSPICKVPNLGFKKIDLFLMYTIVNKLGGYEVVTARRLWKVVYNELGGSPGSTSAATCTRRHYEKLMLPYEQHIRGGNQRLSKPKAPTGTVVTVRKPVRGRVQSTLRKNGVTNQAAPPDGARLRKRGRPPGKRNIKVLARVARVGRPPSHTKSSTETVVSEVQPITVPQDGKISPTPLATTGHIPQQINSEADLKVKQENETSNLCLLSGQPKLQVGGVLEGFSPTKGMCPLDFFRSRLGLSGVTGPEKTQEASITSQTNARSPETPENLQHQCSGCNSEHPSWTGGPREGLTAKPQLPPLKILPLDIDCSLQLRQLMHTRIGTAHMNTFTKRLSEALAQDLSKTNGHAGPVSQEQAVPLNLSKKPTTKRSSDDVDPPWQRDPEAKRIKMEPIDLRLTLKQNGGSVAQTLVQDEPADLTCPRRVRALDRTCLLLTGSQDSYPTDSVFPLSIVSSSGGSLKRHENDSDLVDLKTPERLNHITESCPEVEQLSQCIPYKDSNSMDCKVSALVSNPSQSC
ncbi:AT-rich interactive domain-containing protein 5B [Bagarius yarrelli]|uniref:BRCA1-A complex subunit RAP80 n=1 Tax=Bagarius yarrelli TaxID=175774 RepID=A0A556UYM2_BAGYA|nr:AT-rich interactive domain-containing protein 5B [Bagarius yarrelli]